VTDEGKLIAILNQNDTQ